ncbi:MAG: dihydrolipoyllysine-residue succinyltransferase [Candidatus Sumerlaeota bacterium]|nr:dihydrolipoyllysine-residue succinyltransferase [Candidatus Sumerlaeota bacterium]
MTIDLIVPSSGESVTEAQIGAWLKAEGDFVERDEPLVSLETDKASLELPAPAAGRLAKILKRSGEKVKVGDVIAHVEEVAAPPKPTEGQPPSRPPSTPSTSPIPSIPSASSAPSIPSTPSIASTPSTPRQEEARPMSPMRRTIARRLVEAQQTAALLTTFNEIDMSAVVALRAESQQAFQGKYKTKLGFMSFFVKAAIDALTRFPQVNAEIRGESIVYRNYYDVGIAIATDAGLVVPVLRNAEALSFAEIEIAIADFAARARARKISLEELEGGTFTITNGGVFGSLFSTPIINPPQSGVLGMHAIQDRPIAVGGQVVIRPMMYVALTYDHRLVDGREAVLFLRRVKEVIEDPARILLEV